MESNTVWQQDNSTPENTQNLEKIVQWWSSLNGNKINWIQRMIPQVGSFDEIHWTPQRFDDSFILIKPSFREDTLYWHTSDSEATHNMMVAKLELDHIHQHLYIYPQTQSEVIIRVETPEIKYQTLNLQNPEVLLTENQGLTLRDPHQQIEIKVTFSAEQWKKLKEKLQ